MAAQVVGAKSMPLRTTLSLLCVLWLHGVVDAARMPMLRNSSGLAQNSSAIRSNSTQSPTFVDYVESVSTGRGIWKWSNALAAYDRHIGPWKGHAIRLGEVGVWSGGSLLMWHAVLGQQCSVYGMDISRDALNFADPAGRTSITLLDQGSPAAWASFFDSVTPSLEVLVDDGGHTSPLMITTVVSVWPHLTPGGILAIEDIHGPSYLESFFYPTAQFFAGPASADVGSLHVYPFVLIVQKKNPAWPSFDPSVLPGAVVSPTGRVTTLEQLPAALEAAPAGSLVILENPALGSFLSQHMIASFFQHFNDLHTPLAMNDVPAGCALTNAPVCASRVENSAQQMKVVGVHILPTKFVVEIATTAPVIEAVRHGTEWVKYPRHS